MLKDQLSLSVKKDIFVFYEKLIHYVNSITLRKVSYNMLDDQLTLLWAMYLVYSE